MTDAALQVRSVSKRFGVTQALQDVSLRVDPGSSVALVGRNGAGKSTLVSIITGLQSADTGSVTFAGGSDSRDQIGCVYQKSTLIPWVTASENISLQRFPRTRIGTIDWPQVRRRGRSALEEWSYGHVADTLVADLEPVDRKVVEICRVLSLNPKVLLLDEPTAGLDRTGAARLFDHILEARRRGVAIVYVSHHLQEAFVVCDRTTVLRDGRVVLDGSLDGLTVPDLVAAMVGPEHESLSARVPKPVDKSKEPILRADSINLATRVVDVSLQVRPGECLGIAGLDGSGHVNVGEILSGLRRPTSGTLTHNGRPLKLGDISASIRSGIGFVPEDRHVGGYVPGMSVAENATLPVLYQLATRFRTIRAKVRDRLYGALAEAWDIKSWGPAQPVEELSGGNQQKVVLARSLSSDPNVLVLMNPTAGVDVAAKQSIYGTISELAESGTKGIVIVSADDADFHLCHSVLAMYQGRVHRTLDAPFSDAELASAIQGN